MDSDRARLGDIAGRLLAARSTGSLIVDWPENLQPQSFEQAYAIQALQMQALGEIGGWKVGAASPQAVPTCAPIPISGLHESSAQPSEPRRFSRWLEVELGFRMAADLPPGNGPYSAEQVWSAVGNPCVAVEIVESRYADPKAVGRLSTLADLASHGGLIYQEREEKGVMTSLEADTFSLQVGDKLERGPSINPAGDPLRLLTWLANHGSHHLGGLRKGQVVITGSALPVLLATPGDTVHAAVQSVGAMSFVF